MTYEIIPVDEIRQTRQKVWAATIARRLATFSAEIRNMVLEDISGVIIINDVRYSLKEKPQNYLIYNSRDIVDVFASTLEYPRPIGGGSWHENYMWRSKTRDEWHPLVLEFVKQYEAAGYVFQTTDHTAIFSWEKKYHE